MPERILIIDDEPNITEAFSSLLTDEGYATASCASAEDALKLIESTRFDLVLLDINLPGKSGVDFLRETATVEPPLTMLVVSGQSDIPTALEAVKLGAVDYLEKPVPPEKLLASVSSALMLGAANRQRALLLEELDRESTIIGRSAAIRRLLADIDRVAPTPATVLITGENGTGKELAATRLYLASGRKDKPFVKVNCPGVPPTLFESELFGHKKGAFTGAVRDYPGKFALADGGTIFLDEIGDLPLECQAKLLRVLESGEVEQLGAVQRREVDVRVVCATNRDLKQLVAERKFREDLYYRISVLIIDLPPLRKRRDDVPILAGEFLKRFDPSGSLRIAPDAMAFLATLDYPGNVRQLKNMIERLTILVRGHEVGVDDIIADPTAGIPAGIEINEKMSLTERVAAFEKHLILVTLEQAGGNISEAARVLGVDRASLSRRVKEFNLK